MLDDTSRTGADDAAFRSGCPAEKTSLRDNLESIAIAFLLVLCVRQVVVEAFRIRHGSMAPTLIGDHREARCPNCGWVFVVGDDKVSHRGEVECPNCRFHWPGAARRDRRGRDLVFRQPEWLWNTAYSANGDVISGTDGANRVHRGAARIFVNKCAYRLRAPRRWEVAVFIFPLYDAYCPSCDWSGTVESSDVAKCPVCGSTRLRLEARNFIKRITGLPGERVQLRDGDVYVDGRIARKPGRIQDSLWFHVFDSRFVPEKEVVPTWSFSPHEGRWSPASQPGSLSLDALDAARLVMGTFAREITDVYPYDGLSYRVSPYGAGSSGRQPVGDCRVLVRATVQETVPSGGELVLAIEDAGREFRFLLSTQGMALEDGANRVCESGADRLVPRRTYRVGLENYDDRVVCTLDGRKAFRYDYDGAGSGGRGVRLGARGAKVLWERILVQRDIHYTYGSGGDAPSPVFELGAGEYFMLGDNSPASSDSRKWDRPGIPEENIIGRACFVFWPVHRMRWLSAGVAE
jgi:signal peptidase I